MGELFRRTQTGTPLTWTGERMVPGQTGAIEAEHLHRYFLARELCRGMDVLDVASGEGYGSAFLAQTARRVIGVDVDLATVEHATREYQSANLQFLHGDATNLPSEDHSLDIVVSFETIEHLSDHRAFLAEVKRVLRPNGFLLISTPDMNVYSARGTDSNPFHVRELTEAEFRATLSASFRRVELLRQRAITGSAILPDTIGAGTNSLPIFEQRDGLTFEAASGLLRAPYLLAVASDHALPAVVVSLFVQKDYESELRAADEKIHQEWSQRIQAEEQYAKTIAELERVKEQYDTDLRAAVEKTHSEWAQRIRIEEALAVARQETESLNNFLKENLEQRAQEITKLQTTNELLNGGLAQRAQEITRLQITNETLNWNLARTEQEASGIREAHVDLSRKLAEAGQETYHLRTANADLKADLLEQIKQVEALHTKLADGEVSAKEAIQKLNQDMQLHRNQADSELIALTAQLKDARATANVFRNELHQATSSRSWKITEPLRKWNRFRKQWTRNTTSANSPAIDSSASAGEGGMPCALAMHDAGSGPYSAETPPADVPELAANGAGPDGPAIDMSADPNDGDGSSAFFGSEGREIWSRVGGTRLKALLNSTAEIGLPVVDNPALSILLVLYNKAHLTLLCLESILLHADVAYEVIVVDNASTDETSQLLEHVAGARIIRNLSNAGFGPACMQAARAAKGKYLCFLNNDALLEPKALSRALADFTSSADVGAVGGKILLADGRLQEAGSIVWSDGSALGYGRADNADVSQYQFRRPVDFCSGAFLFVPRTLFFEVGGFSDRFAPAYYEDTDLCMKIWDRGLKVIYEPGAAIRHYESASSEGSESAVSLMITNQEHFKCEWSHVLSQHLDPIPQNILRARIATRSSGLRIVYLDDRIPHRELGSGFPRSNDILRELVALGHHVSCVGLNFPQDPKGDEYRDVPCEVELVDGTARYHCVLREYLPTADLIWVSRPHNMERLLRDIVTRAQLQEARIVYDAEAIFSDRDALKAHVSGRGLAPALLSAWAAREAALARVADLTVAVSERDARTMRSRGVSPVQVVGFCLDARPTAAAFCDRNVFLFLGAVHGSDNPNLDSLRYFVRDVWPAVLNGTNAELVIAGYGTNSLAEEFRLPGVRVVGAQKLIEPLYESARVVIVPTRYCAGLPYKAYEAAAHGVPIVVTPIILEQLGWEDVTDCLMGVDAGALAGACERLFNNETLWNAVRSNALKRIENELNPEIFRKKIASVLDAACGRASQIERKYDARVTTA